jgi:hypothetical protein
MTDERRLLTAGYLVLGVAMIFTASARRAAMQEVEERRAVVDAYMDSAASLIDRADYAQRRWRELCYRAAIDRNLSPVLQCDE